MSSLRDILEAAPLPSTDQEIPLPADGHRNKRPAPRGTAAYPRKRAVTACQVCRARRTKCDNAKPSCSFCTRIGAKCIQSPVDLSSFDPASLQILQRLDEIEASIRATAPIVPLSVQHSPANTRTDQASVNQVTKHGLQLLPSNLEELLDSFRFESLQGKKIQLLEVLRQHTASIPWSPTESFSPAISADLEPRNTKVLLDNFFNYCHVKNPILERESCIRRLVAQLAIHGIDWSAESCLVLLVCALGAISTPFGESGSTLPGSTAYNTSQSYFKAAQKRLGTLVGTAGVIEAQCLFLAGVYSMCIFKPSNAWRFFSQALACCQEFAFIVQAAPMWRDTEAFETQQNPQRLSVAEQAIYWSSWKSEREMREDLQPHDFYLSESERTFYPSFFPTPPQPEELEESWDNSHLERQKTGWYFYLTEISLRRLIAGLVDEVINFKPPPGKSFLQGLASIIPSQKAKVDEWLANLPAEMSLDTPPELDDVTKFVIRGHLHNLYELLYCPFLAAYLKNAEDSNVDEILTRRPPVGDEALLDHKIRSLAEIALAKHVERIHTNKPGYHHRHHGTYPMTRTCTRSALILLKTALFTQRHEDGIFVALPHGWQDAVLDVIQLNRFWENEIPDAAHRIPLIEELWLKVQDVV